MVEKNMGHPADVLKKYWNYNTFRWPQEQIINSVLAGKDTLAIMPTGGGKSLCYQLPALMLKGVCLVISPLIALMKDQVFQLKQRNISAAAIYAGMDKEAVSNTLNQAIDGKLIFLYVSPERLKTKTFLQALRYMHVSLLAVDEAHCISKWGYDFRPAYLEIHRIKETLSHIHFPIIALTATATRAVRKDICEKLHLSRPNEFIKSFARENLSYEVNESEIKETNALEFLHQHPGAAIVYAKTRKRTVETANFLQKKGINADFYHAGLSMSERNRKQDHWINSNNAVMVATNAFGMGIDKANVRTVVHLDLPDNLEAYYQESGRAGRDGKPCDALLLFNESDVLTLEKNLDQKYPPTETLKKTYQALANFYQVSAGEQELTYYDFNEHNFTATFGLNVLETHYSLKLLHSENLIYLSDSFFQPSKIRILYKSHQLMDFQNNNSEADEVIKAILRIYGGEIFSGFMTIQEAEITAAISLGYKRTVEILNYLKERRVIDYEPQNSSPQISFLTFRYDAATLPINHKALAERKSNDRRAMKAIINYARQEQVCRMVLIQDYFDEDKPVPCGKCDICIQQKELGLDAEEALYLKQQIFSMLPSTLAHLQEQIGLNNKPIAAKIIKNSLDNGELKLDALGLLFHDK